MQRKKLGTSLPTLSPEQAAFLQAAKPVPALEEENKSTPSLAPEPSPKNNEPVESVALESVPVSALAPEPVQTRASRNERKENAVPKEASEVQEAFIADSFKLPQSVHRRLLRASSERKLERVKPYTKQDIVASALDEWLSKRGYTGIKQASHQGSAAAKAMG